MATITQEEWKQLIVEIEERATFMQHKERTLKGIEIKRLLTILRKHLNIIEGGKTDG